MDLFLFHALLLAWCSLGAARNLSASTSLRLLAAALLAWGNLVVTSLLLSAGNQLAHQEWFVGVSAALAGGTWLSSRRAPQPIAAADAGPKPRRCLTAWFIVTITPLALACVWVASIYEPNNVGSLTHDLPRVMYYLGQGNLHPFASLDPRQTNLPFNYHLLLLFGSVYGAPWQCLNAFNLAAWGLAGVVVYHFCRQLKIHPEASLLASWLALTTPPLLAQASTTTPELAAAVACLGAVVFAREWRLSRQVPQAWLAGLAAGLAVGAHSSVWPWMTGAGLLGLLLSWRQDEINLSFFRAWMPAAVLALLTSAPFVVIPWLAQDAPLPIPSTPPFIFSAPLWSTLMPRFASPASVLTVNEDVIGYGLTGLLVLLGTALAMFAAPSKSVRWWAGLGIGSIALTVTVPLGLAGHPRELIVILLALSPCVAIWIAKALDAPGKLSRSATTLLLIFIGLAASWSAGSYLLNNSNRPLAPLLQGQPVPPAYAPLPLRMQFRLSAQPRIAVDTDSSHEAIFQLMTLRHRQRFTAGRIAHQTAYTLFSRSPGGAQAGHQDNTTPSVHRLISIPGKATGGVEFLALLSEGPSPREYYGLDPNTGSSPISPSNSNILLFLSRSPAAPPHHSERLLRVEGLNPEDHLELEIGQESQDGGFQWLGSMIDSGEKALVLANITRPLEIRVISSSGERIVSTQIPSDSGPASSQAKDPGPPTNTRSLFLTDLVLARDRGTFAIAGLDPTEGPFPLRDLPYIRMARQPVVEIRIPAQSELSRLKLTFSARLLARPKAELDIFFNGKRVGHCRFESPTAWQEQTIDIEATAGENTLEFRDVPLQAELNWKAYLETYPDVLNYLISNNIPLEAGAIEHYTLSGRPEGRIMKMMAIPSPKPGDYFFVFRQLQLEGFSGP